MRLPDQQTPTRRPLRAGRISRRGDRHDRAGPGSVRVRGDAPRQPPGARRAFLFDRAGGPRAQPADGRKATTARVTEIMATDLVEMFEDRRIEIPADARLRDDLRRPEKVTSPGGRVSIAASRDGDGHADRFWSLALAVRAGRAQTTPRSAPAGLRFAGRSALRIARPARSAGRTRATPHPRASLNLPAIRRKDVTSDGVFRVDSCQPCIHVGRSFDCARIAPLRMTALFAAPTHFHDEHSHRTPRQPVSVPARQRRRRRSRTRNSSPRAELETLAYRRFNPLATLTAAVAFQRARRASARASSCPPPGSGRRSPGATKPSPPSRPSARKPSPCATGRVLPLDDSPAAQDQAAALRHFYRHLRAAHALNRHTAGGFPLLVTQMMEAVSFGYAAHHLIWQPGHGPPAHAALGPASCPR